MRKNIFPKGKNYIEKEHNVIKLIDACIGSLDRMAKMILRFDFAGALQTQGIIEDSGFCKETIIDLQNAYAGAKLQQRHGGICQICHKPIDYVNGDYMEFENTYLNNRNKVFRHIKCFQKQVNAR